MSFGSRIRDPGPGIRDPEKTYSGSGIPDPGIKKALDPGSGSATLLSCLLLAERDECSKFSFRLYFTICIILKVYQPLLFFY
jgi:hypothetical protein